MVRAINWGGPFCHWELSMAPCLRRLWWPQELLWPVEKCTLVYLESLRGPGAGPPWLKQRITRCTQVGSLTRANLLLILRPFSLFLLFIASSQTHFLVIPIRLCRLMSFKSSTEISLPNSPLQSHLSPPTHGDPRSLPHQQASLCFLKDGRDRGG